MCKSFYNLGLACFLVAVSVAAQGQTGYRMAGDFSNIDGWQVSMACELTNVGMEEMTVRSIPYQSDAGSCYTTGLGIDLATYGRAQIRIKPDESNTAPVDFRLDFRGEGWEIWEPAGYAQWVRLDGSGWRTLVYDFPAGSTPFVVRSANLFIRTDGPNYPRCAYQVDFILLSEKTVGTYEDEPADYTPPVEPMETGPRYMNYEGYVQLHYEELYEQAQALVGGVSEPWAGRVVVSEDANRIDLVREVTSLSFNKSKAMVDSLTIRGWELSTECALGNLVIGDAGGRFTSSAMPRMGC